MTGSTHLAFGLLNAAGLLLVAQVPPPAQSLTLAGAALGSLLPDLDRPDSTLGRLCPPLATVVERRWGHRTVTHSLAALSALALVTLPAMDHVPWAWVAFLLGFASHLLLDCATPTGVPLFYPATYSVLFWPGNPVGHQDAQGRCPGERALRVILLLLLAGGLLLSAAGGLWPLLHRALGTPAAAFAEYQQFSGEAILEFRGRWRDTRREIGGQAPILAADRRGFTIALGSRLLRYGEEGQIMPERARVYATGRTIGLDTVEVDQRDWPWVLARMGAGADSVWVSGRLEADRPFGQRGTSLDELAALAAASGSPGVPADPPGPDQPREEPRPLQWRGLRVVLDRASTACLQTLDPVAAVDPERRAILWQQLKASRRQLGSLRLHCPAPSAETLQAAVLECDALGRRYRAMVDSPVRFTGILYRRAHRR